MHMHPCVENPTRQQPKAGTFYYGAGFIKASHSLSSHSLPREGPGRPAQASLPQHARRGMPAARRTCWRQARKRTCVRGPDMVPASAVGSSDAARPSGQGAARRRDAMAVASFGEPPRIGTVWFEINRLGDAMRELRQLASCAGAGRAPARARLARSSGSRPAWEAGRVKVSQG